MLTNDAEGRLFDRKYYSEPQPDITLLKHREDFYPDELPKAEDVLLLIEVADTKAFPDISLTAKQIIG